MARGNQAEVSEDVKNDAGEAAVTETAKKKRAPQKATPTTALLYIDDKGKPALYFAGRNGSQLLGKFQEAQKSGIELTVAQFTMKREDDHKEGDAE